MVLTGVAAVLCESVFTMSVCDRILPLFSLWGGEVQNVGTLSTGIFSALNFLKFSAWTVVRRNPLKDVSSSAPGPVHTGRVERCISGQDAPSVMENAV